MSSGSDGLPCGWFVGGPYGMHAVSARGSNGGVNGVLPEAPTDNVVHGRHAAGR